MQLEEAFISQGLFIFAANLNDPFMIIFEEALSIINNTRVSCTTEHVSLEISAGRILAEDVYSDVEMPPFDKAAVDGFACRRADLHGLLEVIEVIPAGKKPEKAVTAGKCSRIMTGAMVPEGADTIIMVEHTEETEDGSVRFLKEKTSANIAYRAEDVKLGQQVLNKGTLLRPQHIAILAAVGIPEPLVYRKPVIGIISTGDELTEPENKPRTGQIRNSNAWQLMAQANQLGLKTVYTGIAADTPESVKKHIQEAFDKSDIVLLTGGVSMGDFDHVPEVMQKLGVEIQFKSIAVQPGRPTVFGIRDEKFIFGLPGNPVSSFVQFELLVKQLIYRIMGHQFKPVVLRLPMASDYTRKKAERKSFIPVKINENGMIEPIEYHGSAHIHAYEEAGGMMAVEIGEAKITKGALRDVRQL